MHSVPLRIASYAFAGVFLTVVLAWAAALWLPIPAGSEGERPPLQRIDALLAGEHLTHHRAGFARAEWQVFTPAGGWKQEARLARYGFPFLALEWQHVFDLEDDAEVKLGLLDGGLTFERVWRPYIPYRSAFRSTVPLRPVWIGFVLNVGLWAMAAWALCRGGRALMWRWTGRSARDAIWRTMIRTAMAVPPALVVTVLVALACAIWSPLKSKTVLQPPSPGELIGDTWAFDDWRAPVGVNMDEHLLHTGVGVRVDTLDVTRFALNCIVPGPVINIGSDTSAGGAIAPTAVVPPTPAAPRSIARMRVGWPFSALECRPERLPPAGAIGLPAAPALTSRDIWQEGLTPPFQTAPLTASVPRRLPLRPVWHGLLANVVLFSLLISAAFATAGRGVRARRRHRNLCERCGYDVHGLATCPECGRATGGRQCAGGCASSSASSSA